MLKQMCVFQELNVEVYPVRVSRKHGLIVGRSGEKGTVIARVTAEVSSLVFAHSLLHAGAKVQRGGKLICDNLVET